MILSICLNTSLDTRYTAPGFKKGGIHSVAPPSVTAGGKGLNLARVAAQLGASVTALGLVGERDLDFFTQAMEAEGVSPRFTPLPSPSRRCLNIIDPDTKSVTEILEQGYPARQEHFQSLLSQVEAMAPQAAVIAASGSVPPGLDPDVYAQLGELARRLGKPFVLDARGRHLQEGLKGRPFAVKPNRRELETWAGAPLETDADIAAALLRLAQAGVALATVSLGAEGAMAAAQGKLWLARPPRVEVVNPVGAGDAFAAGLCVAITRNLSLPETLALAVASGAASAMHPETGHVDIMRLEQLLPQVEITEI
ncbi:MAG: 1-phosphofructokinase family hexose kinase [Bacillota bacterium]